MNDLYEDIGPKLDEYKFFGMEVKQVVQCLIMLENKYITVYTCSNILSMKYKLFFTVSGGR